MNLKTSPVRKTCLFWEDVIRARAGALSGARMTGTWEGNQGLAAGALHIHLQPNGQEESASLA